MDVLTRYHRMLGDNADWLPGLDHAAIATEAVLLQRTRERRTSREDLGRERFVERAWEWSRDLRRHDQRAVPRAWVRARLAARALHDGRRALAPRCARSSSALPRGTDLSRQAADQLGSQRSDDRLGCRGGPRRARRDALARRYPFATDEPDAGIEIATTRPETMLGDVAIAVHPRRRAVRRADRTQRLAAAAARARDPDRRRRGRRSAFGTGAVKVTPAHDQTDYEIGAAPRSADAFGHRTRRAHHGRRRRRRPVRRTRPLRGARAHRRGSARERPARRGRAATGTPSR